MPLIWVLGGERILTPLLAVFLLGERALSAMRRGRIPRPFLFLGLFLASYLISIIQVETTVRYVTFFWDFALYVSLFVVAFVASRDIRNLGTARFLIEQIVTVMLVFNLIALSYFVAGSWSFNTPIGYLLPSELKSTQIGLKVATHSVGRELWFMGINTRLSAVFSSSMQYAAALLLTIPGVYYLAWTSQGTKRLFFILALTASLAAMIFAQGRTAIVMGVAAIAWLSCFLPLVRSRIFGRGSVIIFTLLAVLFAAALALLNIDYLLGQYQEYFVEQRAGSFNERSQVYLRSLEAIVESPIIGYGTQTDALDLAVPLGSHNWYLAVAYKHGLLGLLPLLAFVFSLLCRAFGLSLISSRNSELRSFGLTLFVSVAAHAALCFTAEPIVDGIHTLFLAVYYGIVFAMHRLFIAKHTYRAESLSVA